MGLRSRASSLTTIALHSTAAGISAHGEARANGAARQPIIAARYIGLENESQASLLWRIP